MNSNQGRNGLRLKAWQFGTAAIELALVFPLLFCVTYATVVYGYVFYVQQALNRMAEEALRSAVRIDPTTANYTTALDAAADASVQFSKSITPIINSSQITAGHTLTPATPPASPAPTYTVRLVFPMSALTSNGFATVNLPLIGSFPPLPVNLTATAIAQVN